HVVAEESAVADVVEVLLNIEDPESEPNSRFPATVLKVSEAFCKSRAAARGCFYRLVIQTRCAQAMRLPFLDSLVWAA
ncbi:MAG: hypothetical protein ACK41E_07250, partial [Deinococcales bacterium]